MTALLTTCSVQVPVFLSADELKGLQYMEDIQARTFSYSVVQSQEPQTLGYALQVRLPGSHSALPAMSLLLMAEPVLKRLGLLCHRCCITSTTGVRNQLGAQDSPVGLAAWIAEKFRNWTDCDGDLDRVVTKDELLTNISIYWCAV